MRAARATGTGDRQRVEVLLKYVRTNEHGFYGARSLCPFLLDQARLVCVEGSGAVQKQMDLIVACRFKKQGMRWSRDGGFGRSSFDLRGWTERPESRIIAGIEASEPSGAAAACAANISYRQLEPETFVGSAIRGELGPRKIGNPRTLLLRSVHERRSGGKLGLVSSCVFSRGAPVKRRMQVNVFAHLMPVR